MIDDRVSTSAHTGVICGELTLTHHLEEVEQAQAMAERLCESAGARDDAFRVGLSVREAVINALTHGNRFVEHKRVFVAFELRGSRLSVRIRDEGIGFELGQVADPLLEENRLKPRGRGLFLMRAFMDQVTVSREEEGGWEVLMTRELTCQAHPPQCAVHVSEHPNTGAHTK